MEEIVNIPVKQQLYQHFRCVLGHSKRTSNDPQIKVFHENIKLIYNLHEIKYLHQLRSGLVGEYGLY
jgi:hypothetical protein